MGSVTPVGSWERIYVYMFKTHYSPINKKKKLPYCLRGCWKKKKDYDYEGSILAYLQGFNQNPPFYNSTFSLLRYYQSEVLMVISLH